MMRALLHLLLLGAVVAASTPAQGVLTSYPVPRGSHPHDVAPAPDGRVWFTAQSKGALGWLEPATGATGSISLGDNSRPHGVIVGPDGAPWVTDGGLNALVRVDPVSRRSRMFSLPPNAPDVDLNTAAFDRFGSLWFTGQRGSYGWLDPSSGKLGVMAAPQGRGPYGIASSVDGLVYFVSLAGSYLGCIDPASKSLAVIRPPGTAQGTRRVWADSKGVLWITGWSSGNLLRYDPLPGTWMQIRLPGSQPLPYAVYVDERDKVWLSDFSANAILRYDPVTRRFAAFPLPHPDASVRQLLGRRGEVWGAESGADALVVIRF